MDSATLGLVAAGLVARKALEAPGDHAGESAWGLLGRVGDRVRNWFGDRDDAEGLHALERAESAPGHRHGLEALAASIARAAKADPDGATDLSLLLDAIRSQARPEVATFVKDVYAGARVGRIVHTRQTRQTRQGGEAHEDGAGYG
jgi:hypothetical protein